MTILLFVLIAALAFEYINGFHDAANSIATVVSTKVLTPRQAILLAAACDIVGSLTGTAVATTIGKGIVDTHFVNMHTIFAALLAAIIWNLLTWALGLPSSSSHALIGGLCGAALATAGSWSVMHWSIVNAAGKHEGLWPKVILPMVTSPAMGFIIGALFMLLITVCFFWIRPKTGSKVFGRLQVLSASLMALSHGSNDAQKTMGILTLALFTATADGLFNGLPSWLGFLNTPEFVVHDWIIILCAITMGTGTATGGWRIIKTMGHKMVRLQPVHGFAAETTASVIIQFCTHLGIPVSTTHVISTSIMGVGSTKRFSAVKWGIVGKIVWAWVLTLPVTGVLGYFLFKLIG